MDLTSKKCVPCKGSTEPLSKEEMEKYLKNVDSWQLKGNILYREFTFKDFVEAMLFVDSVADLAEEEGHHPDIHISWNKVKLELTTHTIKGLSENDFIMAAKINQRLR